MNPSYPLFFNYRCISYVTCLFVHYFLVFPNITCPLCAIRARGGTKSVCIILHKFAGKHELHLLFSFFFFIIKFSPNLERRFSFVLFFFVGDMGRRFMLLYQYTEVTQKKSGGCLQLILKNRRTRCRRAITGRNITRQSREITVKEKKQKKNRHQNYKKKGAKKTKMKSVGSYPYQA